MKLRTPRLWSNPNPVVVPALFQYPTRVPAINALKTLGNLEEAAKLQTLWDEEKATNNRLRKEHTQAVRKAKVANQAAYDAYVALWSAAPDEEKMVFCEDCWKEAPAPLYLAYVVDDYGWNGKPIAFRKERVCRDCVRKHEDNYLPNPFA